MKKKLDYVLGFTFPFALVGLVILLVLYEGVKAYQWSGGLNG
jgi:hypothetical protein